MKFTWVDGLMILLSVLVIYMILTRIFGHSATELTIMITLFTLLGINQYKLNRELGEQNMMIKGSFERMRDAVQEIKGEMHEMKADIHGIKGRLDALERRARR